MIIRGNIARLGTDSMLSPSHTRREFLSTKLLDRETGVLLLFDDASEVRFRNRQSPMH